MNYPALKFELNIDLDKQMAGEFYSNQNHGGANFWEGALFFHPDLKIIQSREGIEKYIDRYYKEDSERIKARTAQLEDLYLAKAETYFAIIDRIFSGHAWPTSNCVACASIFPWGPRFLYNHSFQFCLLFNDEAVFGQIFHEMLHFIFYDYVQKNYPDTWGQMDTESGKFWDLAEIFNAAIQRTDDFVELHGKVSIGYPDHEEIIPIAKEIWDKDKDVDKWIEKMSQILAGSYSE